MARRPEEEPPNTPGGHAAARLRQFEEARYGPAPDADDQVGTTGVETPAPAAAGADEQPRGAAPAEKAGEV